MTTDTLARPARPRPAPITLTPGAERRIADLIAKAPGPVAGVRLSTPKRGCSGLAYSIDYVETAKPGDEAIETPSGTLFVDGGSLLYLIGSVMDWREDDFTAGFVFENPNAKGSCGCGESFTV
ncbi:iron-sulfur cluster assembly accessory protein [Sandaracinobacter sp. RS1-74]|uniref:HesB/IscA family protein n=1 Tax=Sandaracinobacteroides sayramensis TaxID=2913411 RepID=UPI001ED9D184|nr:iron-sulfur cluster assembly accessory protein [Sandaracinobacteroides sayramensis]MCG2840737.1 iron-sulfur cluster assembly accessory protein [Sandaracinobacteroides sayramensis]